MVKLLSVLGWGIALGLLAISFINASWIVVVPAGAVKLIATRTADKTAGGDDCPTMAGMRQAMVDSGGRLAIDVPTKPGCTGAADALTQLPRYDFVIRLGDAGTALGVFDQIKRPIDKRYSFVGDAAQIAAIRAKAPGAWAWTIAEGRACFADYLVSGWFGTVPDSCAGKTMLVPIDQTWKVAGWPRRFMARMEAAGTRVILTAPDAGGGITGLTALEQIPQVSRDYTGYLWVDDAKLIGPAIRR